MSDPEPSTSREVTMVPVAFRPVTDWVRLAFDSFLAVILAATLIATRTPVAPPPPALTPAPPVQTLSAVSDASDAASPPASMEEAPASGFLATALQYDRTTSGTYAEMAKQIRLGKVTHRDQALAIAKSHGDIMGTAFDALFDEGCDEDGEIVKPKFLYTQLGAAAAATDRGD